MNGKLRNRLIATPYTIWMIGFIVIPLIFVVYYAFTNDSNAFTLENVISFLTLYILKVLYRRLNLH